VQVIEEVWPAAIRWRCASDPPYLPCAGRGAAVQVRAIQREPPLRNPTTFRIALVGVPNCGKTALFNGYRKPPESGQLSGRHRRAKEGAFASVNRQRHYQLFDLPGTYSLVPANA